MSTVYTLRAQVAELDKIARAALELSKSAHARLDVAPKVGPAGERGLKGDAGRDAVCCCKNGADSHVPGPRGERGLTGSSGRNGTDGLDAPDASIYRNECLERDRTIKALRSEVDALRKDFDLLVQALTGQFTKNQDYIAFLIARNEQRRKDHTQ